MKLNLDELNKLSQEELLLVLLDGAVESTKISKIAIIDGDMQKSHKELIRVQDIFTELMLTLDQNAGKWAKDMYNVYDFIRYELSKANITNDIKIIDEVLPIIQQIRTVWYEANNKSINNRQEE
ncbi:MULTISPECIES: flagellar export chaperone FliS [unclassified Clostridioides]|uniref:flagellar export chaperone FliS n=1 Tax=unclassified Clostridioides TaxID=2635829 RepID=UPI001D10CD1A|nr:flagellar export chaperone FliS [Clostridioides sp. ES-S-0001-02]UDN58189.1 flagellar export chaperone FliS [Clostridioides sp. ES-S-0010-02]UDN62218.1 flagellar export chaperone FliS [Clostridioides sp. ES-W-0016-02]